MNKLYYFYFQDIFNTLEFLKNSTLKYAFTIYNNYIFFNLINSNIMQIIKLYFFIELSKTYFDQI